MFVRVYIWWIYSQNCMACVRLYKKERYNMYLFPDCEPYSPPSESTETWVIVVIVVGILVIVTLAVALMCYVK